MEEFIGVVLNVSTTVSNLQEYWSSSKSSMRKFLSLIVHLEENDLCKYFGCFIYMKQIQRTKVLGPRYRKLAIIYKNILFPQEKSQLMSQSIIGFKGKIVSLTYNPNKFTKWEIRIYVLADANTRYSTNINRRVEEISK